MHLRAVGWNTKPSSQPSNPHRHPSPLHQFLLHQKIYGQIYPKITRVWCSALETISARLRKELPGLKGFSETSIKKMRQFSEQWEPTISKSTAVAVDLLATTDRIDERALLYITPQI